MRLRGTLLSLLVVGCASGPRAIPEGQLRALATRSYSAPYDEVFDATSLSLERQGFTLTDANRQAGTLAASFRGARGYDVTFTQRGDEQEVMAVPTPWQPTRTLEGPDGEEARWRALEQGTRGLLATWRRTPEWKLVPEKNRLMVLERFHLDVPREWERLEQSIDRRQVVVQRHGAGHQGLNPTLRVSIERRRPKHELKREVEDVAGLALQSPGAFAAPEALPQQYGTRGAWGTARLLQGGQPQEVAWHLWDSRSPEWTIRVVMVCGLDDGVDGCARDWDVVAAGIDDRGFERTR